MNKTILATGTNGARAATHYQVDHQHCVTYFDMLVSKSRMSSGQHTYTPRRNLPFKMATTLTRIPSVEFYQLNFPEIDTSTIVKDNAPSWGKAFENVNKSKGFLTSVFGALFNGQDPNYEYMAMENVFDGHQPTGVMVWLPESGRKENVTAFAKMLQGIIPEWRVEELHGDVTNNREAEVAIKKAHEQAIKDGKLGVVVCAMKMGSRSFSIPQIDTVILAYDNGAAAQTAQKMSRCLTPYSDGTTKVGRVISLSLDPTREDKLDAPILETAVKLCEKEDIDIHEAVQRVLRTLNIFTMDNNGDRVALEKDAYSQRILDLNSLARTFAKTANIMEILNNEDYLGLLAIGPAKSRLGDVDPDNIRDKGRKFVDKKGRVKGNQNPRDGDERQLYNRMRQLEKALEALATKLHIIRCLVPSASTIAEILSTVIQSDEQSTLFYAEFQVPPTVVLELITHGLVNRHLMDLTISLEASKYAKEREAFWY